MALIISTKRNHSIIEEKVKGSTVADKLACSYSHNFSEITKEFRIFRKGCCLTNALFIWLLSGDHIPPEPGVSVLDYTRLRAERAHQAA